MLLKPQAACLQQQVFIFWAQMRSCPQHHPHAGGSHQVKAPFGMPSLGVGYPQPFAENRLTVSKTHLHRKSHFLCKCKQTHANVKYSSREATQGLHLSHPSTRGSGIARPAVHPALLQPAWSELASDGQGNSSVHTPSEGFLQIAIPFTAP